MIKNKRFTYDKPLVAFSKGGINDNVTGETRKVLLDYGGGSEPEKNDYYTLYLVLGGVTAEKAPSMEKQEERVNNYIQEAINNNILVTNKPY